MLRHYSSPWMTDGDEDDKFSVDFYLFLDFSAQYSYSSRNKMGAKFCCISRSFFSLHRFLFFLSQLLTWFTSASWKIIWIRINSKLDFSYIQCIIWWASHLQMHFQFPLTKLTTKIIDVLPVKSEFHKQLSVNGIPRNLDIINWY